METEDIKKNELDYNDGLGSILSKKGSFEFSWIKTIGVISVLLLFVLMASHLIFNFGREIIQTDNQVVDLGNYTKDHLTEFPDVKSEAIETTIPNTFDTMKKSTIKPHSTESTIPDSLKTNSIEKKQNTKKLNSDTLAYKPKETATGKPTQSESANYKLIVGTYREKQNAITARNKVLKKGFSSFIRISSGNKNGKNYPLYLVQAGAFNRLEDAKTFKVKLSQKNINGYILKI